jgi:hypothetical protein
MPKAAAELLYLFDKPRDNPELLADLVCRAAREIWTFTLMTIVGSNNSERIEAAIGAVLVRMTRLAAARGLRRYRFLAAR